MSTPDLPTIARCVVRTNNATDNRHCRSRLVYMDRLHKQAHTGAKQEGPTSLGLSPVLSYERIRPIRRSEYLCSNPSVILCQQEKSLWLEKIVLDEVRREELCCALSGKRYVLPTSPKGWRLQPTDTSDSIRHHLSLNCLRWWPWLNMPLSPASPYLLPRRFRWIVRFPAPLSFKRAY